MIINRLMYYVKSPLDKLLVETDSLTSAIRAQNLLLVLPYACKDQETMSEYQRECAEIHLSMPEQRQSVFFVVYTNLMHPKTLEALLRH